MNTMVDLTCPFDTETSPMKNVGIPFDVNIPEHYLMATVTTQLSGVLHYDVIIEEYYQDLRMANEVKNRINDTMAMALVEAVKDLQKQIELPEFLPEHMEDILSHFHTHMDGWSILGIYPTQIELRRYAMDKEDTDRICEMIRMAEMAEAMRAQSSPEQQTVHTVNEKLKTAMERFTSDGNYYVLGDALPSSEKKEVSLHSKEPEKKEGSMGINRLDNVRPLNWWKCQCGAENEGKFCASCGAKRPIFG